jgi:riboflavin kinase/FMN adenylyltransferase
MMHMGPRPVYGEADRSLEVHLFGIDADLYGKLVKVTWVARLRDILHLPGPEALRRQLERDREAALLALGVPSPRTPG